jgi:hypothetical protein
MSNGGADARALSRLLSEAVEVRVFDGGATAVRPLSAAPVLTIRDGASLAAIARLLEVSKVTDGACMCLGTSAFEVVSTDESVTVVGLHHGIALRWAGWSGDALLVRGAELVSWLERRGYSGPSAQARNSARRAEEQQRLREHWERHSPACVTDLLPRLYETDGGGLDEEVLSACRVRLAAALPDAANQVRALLRWYGAGFGRFSGYPVYETYPARILADHSIDTVVAAVGGNDDPALWAGTLRHLLSWKSRKPSELRRVPEALWVILESHAAQHPDATLRVRVRAVRGRLAARSRKHLEGPRG